MAPVPLDRPAWTEVVAVLVACTVLLVLLAKLDDSGSRRHASRAAESVKVDAGTLHAAEAEEERWIIATSISPALGVHRIVGPVVHVPEPAQPQASTPARVEPVSYLARRVDSPPSEPAPIPAARLRIPPPAPAPVAAPVAAAPAPAPRPEPTPMPLLMILAATGLTLVAGGVGVLVRR